MPEFSARIRQPSVLDPSPHFAQFHVRAHRGEYCQPCHLFRRGVAASHQAECSLLKDWTNMPNHPRYHVFRNVQCSTIYGPVISSEVVLLKRHLANRREPSVVDQRWISSRATEPRFCNPQEHSGSEVGIQCVIDNLERPENFELFGARGSQSGLRSVGCRS
jgi:hypothetical protein